MGDSTSSRECRAAARGILDLANGEILPGTDPALERHLAGCPSCRERLACDRSDRAAREAAWSATRFPARRGADFQAGVERRAAMAPVRAPAWRRPLVSIAASFLLLAGGIALGFSAGPWVKRWLGPGPVPVQTAVPTARNTDMTVSPALEAMEGDRREKARYAWPELKLVSGRQGGGF